MARLIPPTYSADDISTGERDVLLRIRDDPYTARWVVLHSLDVAEHRRQVSGEVDFVVVVPGKGVLFLEVKGCSRLRREEGLWFYGNDSKGDPRGPFKQASESMHSLRKRMTEKCPGLGRVVCWSAVVMPYVSVPTTSPEWHPWQLVDSRTYFSDTIGVLLARVLDRARARLASVPGAEWFDPAEEAPDDRQTRQIVDVLRPDFECHESGNSRRRRLVEELKYYTDEQLKVLDVLSDNPRMLVSGPAGTGKTLLALEAVRRATFSGQRVLLLCFNRNLAHRLREEVDYARGLVEATTIHGLMQREAAVKTPPGAGEDYWRDTLPRLAVDALLERRADGTLPHDLLVIDEAQDVLGPEVLDLCDLLVAGGLGSGRWTICGDFEDQAIYRVEALEALRSRRLSFVPLTLAVNCRNRPSVAKEAESFGSLSPGYAGVRRPDDGLRPQYRFYDDEEGQQQELADTLLELAREHRSRLGDIVVLSLRSDALCAAERLRTNPGNFRQWLVRWEERTEDTVGFCSVHAFKGLESPAVVLTDVDRLDEKTRRLLYIAETRTLDRLVVLARRRLKDGLTDILERGG